MPKRGLLSRVLPHGHWLCPTKHRCASKRERAGHHQRANRINVADRIKREAARILRRGIAQRQRHPSMRYFMKDNSNDKRRDQQGSKQQSIGHEFPILR